MQTAITIILMMIIGAIIGGFTNFVAIKMLFRPYKTLYIGKWRVPFTPGLIPKRRDELAEQMGKVVTRHLLTSEGIKKKFLNEGFQKEMTGFVQKELGNFLATEKTPAELLAIFEVTDAHLKAETRIHALIEKKYESLLEKYRHQQIEEILPPHLLEKLEAKIPVVSQFILQKGRDYFSSLEGKLRIQRMADDFLNERSGVLGNMMQMFLGNINLADKIQPEIIKFLSNDGTEEMITTLLKTEWEKVLEWEVAKIEEQFKKEELLEMIKGSATKLLGLEQLFQTPLSQLTASFRTELVDTIAPKAVGLFVDFLADRMDVLMERLRLQEIVRQQVENFSVEQLEEMVLTIINRELKMITFLGALLGGAIGFIQGMLAIVMN
ncbi:uncharacterized membrane protein YheB (UPF0754 family) [Cytobacillus eiseniae]|uniref:Uncharacterized membrane protein YheB (UPF0754 family) n=1 Tax=Cytobacillus eiseniae TaxID=762947 RepID=A0ABS4REB0_9BACI|nr:DUF445 family protein [Cytobacillus eiseniae]MBP2241054.1 uncharacterized membrane protein YheB (UPF0754 family) [Cytobacillus eiseniae]